MGYVVIQEIDERLGEIHVRKKGRGCLTLCHLLACLLAPLLRQLKLEKVPTMSMKTDKRMGTSAKSKKNLVGLIRLRLDLSKLSHTYTT